MIGEFEAELQALTTQDLSTSSEQSTQMQGMTQQNQDQSKGYQVIVTGGSPIIGEVHYHS